MLTRWHEESLIARIRAVKDERAAQIDRDREAAGWKRCRRCNGKGRLTARTELLESTADCGDCDGIGWHIPDPPAN